MIAPSAKCPCHSGASYRDCCAPVHRDPTSAATAEALMRSRFSAFALGLVEYLIVTLDPTHPDVGGDPATLRAATIASARGHKYMGLTILEHTADGDEAIVTFRARVFSKGRDVSFVERSTFLRRDGAWRYARGEEIADAPRPTS